jgi:hypothetical protein
MTKTVTFTQPCNGRPPVKRRLKKGMSTGTGSNKDKKDQLNQSTTKNNIRYEKKEIFHCT